MRVVSEGRCLGPKPKPQAASSLDQEWTGCWLIFKPPLLAPNTPVD
jgi:hypothetical protein